MNYFLERLMLGPVIATLMKHCIECRARLDLKRYSSCPDGWVCTQCATELGYTDYQPSLR